MMSGALNDMGLKIRRDNIRESIHRVDQAGVERRRLQHFIEGSIRWLDLMHYGA